MPNLAATLSTAPRPCTAQPSAAAARRPAAYGRSHRARALKTPPPPTNKQQGCHPKPPLDPRTRRSDPRTDHESKHEDVGSGGGGGDGRAMAQRPLPACSLPTTARGRDPRRQVPDPRSRTAERASDSTAAAAPQPCVRREKHPATALLAATGLQWSAPTAVNRRGGEEEASAVGQRAPPGSQVQRVRR